MKAQRALWPLAALALLGGCFGGGDDEAEPAELVPFESTLKIVKVWDASLPSKTDGLLLGLAPVSNGVRLYTAADEGSVYSFDAITGKVQWQVQTGLPLSGGPGLGLDTLALGSRKGDVVLLSTADGAVLWKTNVGSEVLSAPAVGDERVVVRTIDGRLLGLAAKDGSEQWFVERRPPSLSQRGSAAPVISAGAVVCGFEDGVMIAVALDDGELLWETTLSEQRGRNPLDRLADIDSKAVVIGEDVFVTGFQGSSALLALQSGRPVWRQEISSYNDLAVDWNRVYITTSDDEVVALKRESGVIDWRRDGLANRLLSAPATTGTAVALGDFEGYVHWLNADTGEFAARTRAGSGAVTATPLVVGDLVYVQTAKGELAAFRVGQK